MEKEYYDQIKYENGAVRVIYEDNHVLCVVKPAGVLSQGDASDSKDMLSLVKEDLAARGGKPGAAFAGLVHRLDRNTGGTMVFAKTSKGAARLSTELRENRFHKCYFALAEGVFDVKTPMMITDRLEKDEKTNTVRISETGKVSKLLVKTLAMKGNCSLIAASPVTGRTHQIRAQLANAGHPLAGDTKYGAQKIQGNFLGLWSAVVSVKHPVKDVMLVFFSTPEQDSCWKTFDTGLYKAAFEEMESLAENGNKTEKERPGFGKT